MVTSATIMPTAVVVLPTLIVFELITAAVIIAAGCGPRRLQNGLLLPRYAHCCGNFICRVVTKLLRSCCLHFIRKERVVMFLNHVSNSEQIQFNWNSENLATKLKNCVIIQHDTF